MNCDCGEAFNEGDRFCEGCGKQLTLETPPPACPCGAGSAEIGRDGFCNRCGRRAKSSHPRDHAEIELSPSLAAVSDVGKRHARNEDDVALMVAGSTSVLIVSDGVSISFDPQQASRLAVRTVQESLASGDIDEAAVRIAILKAHHAIEQIRGDGETGAATVALAAVDESGQAVIGWIGDSRIYGVSDLGVRQLSRDHSWINEMVDQGTMSYETAAEDKARAHALSRWLGDQGDGSSPEPAVRSVMLRPRESILVCSDGLWNYAPLEADLELLIGTMEGSALELCRQLVSFANMQGGIDNVTAAFLKR